MEKSINALTELQTLGVSLVHRGANKRQFAITKSEVPSMDEKVIESLAVLMKDAEYEDEGAMLEVLKQAKLDQKTINAINGAIRLLSAYADNEAVKRALGQLKAALGPGYAAPAKQQEDDKKKPDYKYPEPMKKGLAALPDEQRAMFEPLIKSALEESQAASQAEAKARIEKAEKDAEDLRRIVKAERDARLTKEFIAKAKDEYPAVPGKPDELGLLLKSMHEKAPDEAKQFEAMLKTVNDALLGSLLVEKGKAGQGDVSDDPWRNIEKAAVSAATAQ